MSFAKEAWQITIQNEVHLVGFAFLVYDHIITLDTEIRCLWNRRKFASAYSFFFIRYFGLASNIPAAAFQFLTLSPLGYVQEGLSFPQQHLTPSHVAASNGASATPTSSSSYNGWEVVLGLRMYALYNRSRRILWLVGVVSVLLMGFSVWTTQGQQGSLMTVLPGCHPRLAPSTAHRFALSWAVLYAFDTLIFGLTLYHGISMRRKLGSHSPMALHQIILRDGILYFGVLVLSNLANVLTLVGNDDSAAPQPILPGTFATLGNCISITMMSRMMLNLHAQADQGIMKVQSDSGFFAEVPSAIPLRAYPPSSAAYPYAMGSRV
ncbi:hypothetical protein C8R46DRAFT_1234155 [Mycena filopes]|nr:hypothetical protein C8R46DRAFT_1234155 [Mycena filopes]